MLLARYVIHPIRKLKWFFVTSTGRKILILPISASLILALFLFWNLIHTEATVGTVRPDGDVAVGSNWATCTTNGNGNCRFGVVDESGEITGDLIRTGTGGTTGEQEEFTMTSAAGATNAVSQVVVKFQADVVACNGNSTNCDTVDVKIKIDGAYTSAVTKTMTASDTLYTATFTGNWTGDDDLQVQFTRTRVGGGSAASADDDVRLYQVYAEVTYIAQPSTLNQRAGVIENDQNGTNLTSHTAKIGERLKVKLQLDTDSGDYTYKSFKLQYEKNSDGNWYDASPSGEIRPARSMVIRGTESTGTGDSGSCTGGTTARTGYFTERSAITKYLKMYGSACQELGFVIDTKNATTNTTYRFRVRMSSGSGWTDLSSYVAYPSFTTVASGNNTNRYSKSNTVGNATSYDDLKHLLDDSGYSNVGTDDSTREALLNVSSDTTADKTFSGDAGVIDFGVSVASAGDLNGDGYQDVIVGADTITTNTGRAYIFYGGAIINSTPDVTIIGETTSNHFGILVNSAGDVNGDGYSDVVVGASTYSTNTGRAYIFYGSASLSSSLAASSANVIMTGEGTSNWFGVSVDSAGDVNDDGYSDVIVGSDAGGSTGGRAYLYYGGSSMDNTADVVITAEAASNIFGRSVAGAGDVNGDGIADVIVGAGGYNTNVGRAYIFYGSTSLSASIAASSANVIMTGIATDRFGIYVNHAGDVNGDGYSDVIISSYQFSTSTGRAYIYYGAASMSSPVLSSGANVIMTGETSGDQFGICVSSAGDVNGDGYSDAIVGANIYSSSTGRAYIYYGGSSMDSTADVKMTGAGASNGLGTSVASSGDVNGDGYPDLIIGAANSNLTYIYYQGYAINSTMDRNFTGATFNYEVGNAVASAGDVNGDGYSDVLIGAWAFDVSTNAGRVYLFYGGPSMDLTTADVTMTGEANGNSFGYSVSTAGDVNGDGYDDILIGAKSWDVNAGVSTSTNEGRAYIFYGSSSLSSAIGAASANVIISGSGAQAAVGTAVSSAGDLNGDGYSDFAVGADVTNAATGAMYVFYGSSSISSVMATSSANVTMSGVSSGDNFGRTIGSGDINGDGYSDLITGAISFDVGAGTAEGRAYIYYGGSSMNNTADVLITGEVASNGLGNAVAVDDVNGDGYMDAIVGAQVYTTSTGRVYVFYGSSSISASIGAASANLILTGEATATQFGSSIGAGDFNGDGYSDVIVGAKVWDINPGVSTTSNEGRSYVYYGGQAMDSTADLVTNGEASSNNFGTAVASAGDVNGDGYADIAIGANGYTSLTGRAYINLGGGSTYIPTYTFADYSSIACGSLSSINATWNGQSNVAASSKNIILEVYRFGATNAWETVTTESALAVNTDGNVTGSKSSNLSEYCDGSNWSYWRVYQASGTENLQTDYWNMTFSTGGNSTSIRGGVNIRRGSTIR